MRPYGSEQGSWSTLGGSNARGCPGVPGAGTYCRAQPNGYTSFNINSYARADGYRDGSPNGCANAYSHTDAYSNAYSYPSAYGYRDGSPNTYTNAYAYSDTSAHQHPNPNAGAHTYSYSNTCAYSS